MDDDCKIVSCIKSVLGREGKGGRGGERIDNWNWSRGQFEVELWRETTSTAGK